MSFDRRTYDREWKRRKRAREMAARMAGATRCPARLSRTTICGARLELRISDIGASVLVCPLCERKRLGVCRECPARVAGQVGKALRCAKCAARAMKRSERACYQRHADEYRAHARAYHHRPDVRQRKADYKRVWRKANPEKIRGQKRREALRQLPSRRRYMAAYHAQRQPRMARGHTCLTCSAVLSGRAKKCEPCKTRDRQRAAATLRRMRAA